MINEMQLLIKLTEPLYRPTRISMPNFEEVDMDAFIKLASNNNLLYHVSGKMLNRSEIPIDAKQRFQSIADDGARKIAEIKRSLVALSELLPQSIIFKTFRGSDFNRIPNDIDVLTQNLEEDAKTMAKEGYQLSGYSLKEKSVDLSKAGTWRIHLQGEITWVWERFIDSDLLIKNPRQVTFLGQNVIIPNIEADVLIHMAHMNFEPLNIVYSEMLYLFGLITAMDFEVAQEQTRKYRWEKTFLRTMRFINDYHYSAYGESLTSKLEPRQIRWGQIDFPYCFPRAHLVKTGLEKRLFRYPLTRIPKIIDILSNGDTFTKYINPSDHDGSRAEASHS